MFGVFYLAYCAVTQVIGNIGSNILDAVEKRQSYDPNTGISFDMKGRTYDNTLGGQLVYIDSKNNGRYLIRNPYNGKVLRDVTQERMDAEYQRLKENPDPKHTVVEWSTYADEPHIGDKDYYDLPHGTRYKDVETGDIFVKRCFVNYPYKIAKLPISTFYMSLNTGLLVRVEDGTYEEHKKSLIKNCSRYYTPEKIDSIIEDQKATDAKWIEVFNTRQKDNVEKGMKEIDGRKFWCNSEMR